MTTATDWQAHRRALAEAQAWVALRMKLWGNPAETLRSAELGACLSEYEEKWFWQEFNIPQISELIGCRHELLSTLPRPVKASGRILCCFYDWDTRMGEGTPASQGIIDDNYLPPWDTWFAVLPLVGTPMENLILLAWIPEELTELVQRAIEVAATEPIGWLDEAVTGDWPTDILQFPKGTSSRASSLNLRV